MVKIVNDEIIIALSIEDAKRIKDALILKIDKDSIDNEIISVLSKELTNIAIKNSMIG